MRAPGSSDGDLGQVASPFSSPVPSEARGVGDGAAVERSLFFGKGDHLADMAEVANEIAGKATEALVKQRADGSAENILEALGTWLQRSPEFEQSSPLGPVSSAPPLSATLSRASAGELRSVSEEWQLLPSVGTWYMAVPAGLVPEVEAACKKLGLEECQQAESSKPPQYKKWVHLPSVGTWLYPPARLR